VLQTGWTPAFAESTPYLEQKGSGGSDGSVTCADCTTE